MKQKAELKPRYKVNIPLDWGDAEDIIKVAKELGIDPEDAVRLAIQKGVEAKKK